MTSEQQKVYYQLNPGKAEARRVRQRLQVAAKRAATKLVPVATNSKPVATTSKPVATTSKPVATTYDEAVTEVSE